MSDKLIIGLAAGFLVGVVLGAYISGMYVYARLYGELVKIFEKQKSY